MSIQKKYEELIESSYLELETLKSEVTQLEGIRKNIEILIGSNNELPKIFESKFKKIIKLSEDYSNNLGAATKNYLDGNNSLFTTKLSELAIKIKEFEKEITRLINTDFPKLFKDLQKIFIDHTRRDIAIELKRFEEVAKDLQSKSLALKKQVDRLAGIDLEKHFANLQNTLSEIFGAINNINITLTGVTQTLNSIIQALGATQLSLETNHKETAQSISVLSKKTIDHLKSQDEEAKRNIEHIQIQFKILTEQNNLLKKAMGVNRTFIVIGFVVTIIILGFLIIKF